MIKQASSQPVTPDAIKTGTMKTGTERFQPIRTLLQPTRAREPSKEAAYFIIGQKDRRAQDNDSVSLDEGFLLFLTLVGSIPYSSLY